MFHRAAEGRITAAQTFRLGDDLSVLGTTCSSGVRADRGFLNILDSVYEALLPGLYLELQTFPVETPG